MHIQDEEEAEGGTHRPLMYKQTVSTIYTIETQTENFAPPDDDETDTKAAQNETKTKRTKLNNNKNVACNLLQNVDGGKKRAEERRRKQRKTIKKHEGSI